MNATWAPEPSTSGYGCTTELLILCCHTMLACVCGVFTPHLLATSGVRQQRVTSHCLAYITMVSYVY